jgi:hypothetical protein
MELVIIASRSSALQSRFLIRRSSFPMVASGVFPSLSIVFTIHYFVTILQPFPASFLLISDKFLPLLLVVRQHSSSFVAEFELFQFLLPS